MKNLISSLVVVALLAGCASTPTITKEDVCAAALSAYGIYLAVINASDNPAADQIAAAQAAAAVLTAQCGWTQATTTSRASLASPAAPSPKVDEFGVPVLTPPK